jgi:2-succinyl-6-hydroxy-2,4-cyclohexadiene-1-carboxylate synthase
MTIVGECLLNLQPEKAGDILSDAFMLHVRGVRYHVRVSGAGTPLLLLHGFTGSGAGWGPFADLLSDQFQVIAPDLIGHGGTDAPYDSARYRIEHSAADIVTLAEALALPSPALFGYSMGGRLALYTALAYPERFSALILESASPGLADAGERAARRVQDDVLALAIERDGVPAFVDRWQALPLFASQDALPASDRERIRSGRLSQRAHGLANSLRGIGTGVQPPLWNMLSLFGLPTLLITGVFDVRFSDIARAMCAGIPHVQHAVVAGAGHAPHLEQASQTANVVSTFLGEIP